MNRRNQKWPLLAALLVFGAGVLMAQVRDPKVARSWWPAAKAYIDAQAEAKTLSFAWNGVPTDTLVAVFTPVDSITIQRIDVYATTPNGGDTTALVISNGINQAVVTLDSIGQVQSWFSTTAVTFAKAIPCSVRFSDNAYTGTFVSGVTHPAIVVQYKTAAAQ